MDLWNWIPRVLVGAALVQGLVQAFKLVRSALNTRRVEWKILVSSGGMPSAHTAFVTALTAGVGVHSGPTSDVFSLACVFTAVVIHDAIRVRGALQHHARLLNTLMRRVSPETSQPTEESLGHTPAEVVAGLAVGVGLGLPLQLVLFWI